MHACLKYLAERYPTGNLSAARCEFQMKFHQSVMKVTLLNKSGKHSPSERFFEQFVSNAYNQGGMDNVNPLQIMLTLKYGRIELAGPYLVRLLIWYVPLAEILGFKGFYPEYIYA